MTTRSASTKKLSLALKASPPDPAPPLTATVYRIMKVSKDAARAASRIYRFCAPEGRLNEEKLRSAVAKIVEARPRDYRGILQALQRLVRIDAESRQALVESAAELDAATRQRVEKNLNEQYGGGLTFTYQIDADLLGGTRIRVGNDVWDGSVQSRLNRLANAF